MTVYQYIKTETDRKKLYNGIRAILEEMDERGKWTNCRAEIWATVYELKSPFIAD